MRQRPRLLRVPASQPEGSEIRLRALALWAAGDRALYRRRGPTEQWGHPSGSRRQARFPRFSESINTSAPVPQHPDVLQEPAVLPLAELMLVVRVRMA